MHSHKGLDFIFYRPVRGDDTPLVNERLLQDILSDMQAQEEESDDADTDNELRRNTDNTQPASEQAPVQQPANGAGRNEEEISDPFDPVPQHLAVMEADSARGNERTPLRNNGDVSEPIAAKSEERTVEMKASAVVDVHFR